MATYNGRPLWVKKYRKEDVRIGDNVVKRMVYKDMLENRYIKRKDGTLHRLMHYCSTGRTHVVMYWKVID